MLHSRFILSILVITLSCGCGGSDEDTLSSDSANISSELECEPPLEECYGDCVDLMTDEFHCGDCEISCTFDQTCELGDCVDICEEGLAYCAGTCADLMDDDDHCGACGDACSEGFTCNGEGACEMVADQLFAGGFSTCVLLKSGGTRCWGSLLDQQLETPPSSYRDIAMITEASCIVHDDFSLACSDGDGRGRDQSPAGTFTSASIGTWFACGVNTSGVVSCWGDPAEIADLGDPPEGNYADVTNGSFHACALRAGDQTVTCWGDDVWNQTDSPSGGFRQIASGDAFTCGIRLDDSIECWGDTILGTLSAPPSGTFSRLSAHGSFACAVRGTGALACWGSDADAEDEKLQPPLGTYRDVAVGTYHACAIRDDDRVVCWGTTTVPSF